MKLAQDAAPAQKRFPRRERRRNGGGGVSQIFTVTFHPADDSWLANARRHDRRISLAELAIDAVSGGDEPALIALPAGFLRVGSEEACTRLAETLLDLSRRAQVALAFGIDVAPDGEWAPLAGPTDTFAFACDSGRRVLWPAKQVRASPQRRSRRPDETRCVELAGQKVGVVISGGEAFNAPLRLSLTQSGPDIILGTGRTRRRPIAGRERCRHLHTVAPTFVIAPSAADGRKRCRGVALGGTVLLAPGSRGGDRRDDDSTISRALRNACEWSQSMEDRVIGARLIAILPWPTPQGRTSPVCSNCSRSVVSENNLMSACS